MGDMTGWRDISTAPTDGRRVLLWWMGCTVFAYYTDHYGWVDHAGRRHRYREKRGYRESRHYYSQQPTHWMPRPAPPDGVTSPASG